MPKSVTEVGTCDREHVAGCHVTLNWLFALALALGTAELNSRGSAQRLFTNATATDNRFTHHALYSTARQTQSSVIL